MSEQNHSVSEANKALRVLNGQRRKYTATVHLPSGKTVEFQTDEGVKVAWHDSLRERWLVSSAYPSHDIMQWIEGSILLMEENPKP